MAALYFAAAGLLCLLRWLGWGVEPKAVIEQFNADPSSVMWLLLLAATNVLPTLLHWSLGLAGLWADSIGPDAANARAWVTQVLKGTALGKIDAEDFADYLFGHRLLSLIFALCLLAWALCALRNLVPYSLRWLL
ncbi:hypothetical protein [Methylomonas rhizoryzae]|uniref:hypothetical protein n=1 Tax=Methylomonas rhizoryzae TaxID=2608981 RepID=UPI001232E836|nr:hypothetical protein [Methylomonas rhizoryzae]